MAAILDNTRRGEAERAVVDKIMTPGTGAGDAKRGNTDFSFPPPPIYLDFCARPARTRERVPQTSNMAPD